MLTSRVLSSFNANSLTVTNADQLLQAVRNPNVAVITIEGFLSEVPGFRLSPHQEIRGDSIDTCGLEFRDGDDGGLKTHGPQILPLEQFGSIRNLWVSGGCCNTRQESTQV